MTAGFTDPGEPKPVMTYDELMREHAAAQARRVWHDMVAEHLRDGCPADPAPDGSFRYCVFHGFGAEKPLPGMPRVPRYSPSPQRTIRPRASFPARLKAKARFLPWRRKDRADSKRCSSRALK